MVKTLRRWYITVRESCDTENTIRYADSVVAFTAEEAINELSKNSKFSGGPQGYNNWKPHYPLIFQAKETT